MGHLGRMTNSRTCRPKGLDRLYQGGDGINDAGVKSPTRSKPKRPKRSSRSRADPCALKKNKKAQAAFEKFSPSHKREYIEWITEAKTEATRTRRLETALEWMAEGKPETGST